MKYDEVAVRQAEALVKRAEPVEDARGWVAHYEQRLLSASASLEKARAKLAQAIETFESEQKEAA